MCLARADASRDEVRAAIFKEFHYQSSMELAVRACPVCARVCARACVCVCVCVCVCSRGRIRVRVCLTCGAPAPAGRTKLSRWSGNLCLLTMLHSTRGVSPRVTWAR